MKYNNNSAVFSAAKIFLVALMAMCGWACSDQISDLQNAKSTLDIVESKDYDGYAVGDITNQDGRFHLGFTWTLGYKKLTVDDPAILGKISEVKPQNRNIQPVTEAGKVGERMTQHYNFFFDKQFCDFDGGWLADSLADYHYEIVDAYYVDYTSNQVDDEGLVWQMFPHFAVDYINSEDPSKSGTLHSYPRYLQVLKGVEVIDSLLISKNDYEGHSEAGVTNVLGTGSAELSLTLGSKEVTVEANQFGQLSLTDEGTPKSEDISTAIAKGERTWKDFVFSDGQSAKAIWQYLYQLAAENHVVFTDVKYKDYTATKTGDDTYKITPHFSATYQRVGTLTEQGTVDLYPWYTQRLKKAEDPTFIFEVDEKYTDQEANDVKMRNLNVKIYRKNKDTGETVESWRLRWPVVVSGHVEGRDTVYVSGVEIIDHDFTDQEEMGDAYHYTERPIEDNPMFLETLRSHSYRCEAFAPADGGGKSVMGGQLLYQSSVITFRYGKDFEWTSKEFVKTVERSNEQMTEDPSLAGKTCVASDRTYKYGATHSITATNYLDGEAWFSSTAVSNLWVLQY